MTRYISILLLFIAFVPLQAKAGEMVTYKDGDLELEGYWAASTCEAEQTNPLVLIIHQWKGLTDYEKGRADMLAGECYDAFAIDMYGKGIRPTTIEEAAAQSGKYKNDPTLANARMKAALNYALEKSQAQKTAVMGYCFGGTMALELARSGANIDGAISFHGGLSSKAPATKPGSIKASVLVHHGDIDPFVPPQEVDAFFKEMRAVNADWYFIRYASAKHSFTEVGADNDTIDGTAYNAEADLRSWESTDEFLEELFDEN